jgi:hypothetical protein
VPELSSESWHLHEKHQLEKSLWSTHVTIMRECLPLGTLPCAVPLMYDRRRWTRVALHWPVYLYRRPGLRSVETKTENLTSEGLYCVSKEPFPLGKGLRCRIVIPPESFGYSEGPTLPKCHVLQCHLTVKRVEVLDCGFGLGCHIDDYRVALALPSPAGLCPMTAD